MDWVDWLTVTSFFLTIIIAIITIRISLRDDKKNFSIYAEYTEFIKKISNMNFESDLIINLNLIRQFKYVQKQLFNVNYYFEKKYFHKTNDYWIVEAIRKIDPTDDNLSLMKEIANIKQRIEAETRYEKWK